MGTKTSEGASKSRFQDGFWAPWAALKMVEVQGKEVLFVSFCKRCSAARELYREPAKTHKNKQQKKEKEKEQQKIRKT